MQTLIVKINKTDASLSVDRQLVLGSHYQVQFVGLGDGEIGTLILSSCRKGKTIAATNEDGVLAINTQDAIDVFEKKPNCPYAVTIHAYATVESATIAESSLSLLWSPMQFDVNGSPVQFVGPAGPKGDTGPSLYDTWLEMNPEGTWEEFVNEFHGADGKDGLTLTGDGLYAFTVEGDNLYISANNESVLFGNDEFGNLDKTKPKWKIIDGHLHYIFYKDGKEYTKVNLGSVIGPQGPQGKDGKDGVAGKNGADGVDGHTPTDEELTNLLSRNINDIASAGGLAIGSILDGSSSLGITIEYIKKNLSELNVDSKNSASMEYVDNAIKNIDIPEPDLSGYATEEYVDTQISSHLSEENPHNITIEGLGGMSRDEIENKLEDLPFISSDGGVAVNLQTYSVLKDPIYYCCGKSEVNRTIEISPIQGGGFEITKINEYWSYELWDTVLQEYGTQTDTYSYWVTSGWSTYEDRSIYIGLLFNKETNKFEKLYKGYDENVFQRYDEVYPLDCEFGATLSPVVTLRDIQEVNGTSLLTEPQFNSWKTNPWCEIGQNNFFESRADYPVCIAAYGVVASGGVSIGCRASSFENSVAIGYGATATDSMGVAIGHYAECYKRNSIQLGEGVLDSDSNNILLQVKNFPIINDDGYIFSERIALVSPNGTKYKLVVDDEGNLSTEKI